MPRQPKKKMGTDHGFLFCKFDIMEVKAVT